MEKQEFGSREREKMDSHGAEFGVVPGQSDQESKTKDWRRRRRKTLKIWCCSESEVPRRRYSTRRGTKGRTGWMVRNILTHANLEWREQSSICARILDLTNQDRMKTRRACVVHTNWDNLMMKWSGCQRLWEVSNDRKSFVKTAEELCKRTLERDEDKEKRGFFSCHEEEISEQS